MPPFRFRSGIAKIQVGKRLRLLAKTHPTSSMGQYGVLRSHY